MPWWGSETMATLFSDALGLQLGTPNPPLVVTVPFLPSLLLILAVAFYLSMQSPLIDAVATFVSSSLFTGDGGNESRAYAILATPTPTSVPGPAPLFGAAAALGMSRRLRRRIKLGG